MSVHLEAKYLLQCVAFNLKLLFNLLFIYNMIRGGGGGGWEGVSRVFQGYLLVIVECFKDRSICFGAS